MRRVCTDTLVHYEQTMRLRWKGRREGPAVRPLQPGAKRLSTVALAGPASSFPFPDSPQLSYMCFCPQDHCSCAVVVALNISMTFTLSLNSA